MRKNLLAELSRFFSRQLNRNDSRRRQALEVDFDKSAEIDAEGRSARDINREIADRMYEGCGTITVLNPGAKHSLGVGILNRLNLNFEGSLGYFGCGLNDGPNIHISGRVGWSCAREHDVGHRCYREQCRVDFWCRNPRWRSGLQRAMLAQERALT